MKNGLFFENDELIYYKDGKPRHAGAVKVDGDIYYISKNGRAVKGDYVVHSGMTNGLLKHGTYTFGSDYKLKKGSYVAPVKRKTAKKKKRDKRKKDKKIRKKNLIKISIFAVAAVLMTVTVILVVNNNIHDHAVSVIEKTAKNGEICLPEFESDVLLCSEEAKLLYDGAVSVSQAVSSGTPYLPFVFEYTLAEDGVLFISESEDMFDPLEITLAATDKSVSVNNLKTGTEYYYKVTVGTDEYNGSFRTARSTRYVYFPGAYNVRDIGGYLTLDNKTVKQGYIIRGAEIDGLVEQSYFPNDTDIRNFKQQFGIVYDFDLRGRSIYTGEYQTRFGDTVGHKFYNAVAYGTVFNALYKQTLKDIFSDLADPANYPMYMHCTYGADRTGTVIFLLQGVLNMPEQEMMTEYQRTGIFSSSYLSGEELDSLIHGLQPYKGDTIQKKIVDFLVTDIGVTEEEIESIRHILLE